LAPKPFAPRCHCRRTGLGGEDGACYLVGVHVLLGVEHPITEVGSGIDVVGVDLGVAAGGAHARIEDERTIRERLEEFDDPHEEDVDLEDLSLYSLYPRSHVKVYDIPEHVDLRQGFDFSDDLEIQYTNVSQAGNVLIISFKQPLDVSVGRLAARAPGYIGAARRDPDGKGVRLALAQSVTVHAMAAGEKYFVDLLPATWSGVPPGLPQDVVDEHLEQPHFSGVERGAGQRRQQGPAGKRDVPAVALALRRPPAEFEGDAANDQADQHRALRRVHRRRSRSGRAHGDAKPLARSI